jgi:hypothetical protein
MNSKEASYMSAGKFYPINLLNTPKIVVILRLVLF